MATVTTDSAFIIEADVVCNVCGLFWLTYQSFAAVCIVVLKILLNLMSI